MINNLIEYNIKINIPDHLITGVDFNYISKRHDIYFLKKGYSLYSNNSVIILDNDGKELFNCEYINKGVVVYNKRNVPVINTFIQNSRKQYIYLGEDRNKIISTIKPSNYVKFEYEMEFYNKGTDSQEVLTIIYNAYKKEYSVYCDRDWENETMICSFGFMDYSNFDSYIEVSPWVDYMQMIGIVLCFRSLNI